MTFPKNEPPTRPEGHKSVLRLMLERLRAVDPNDIAVLQALRAASTGSRAALLKYWEACWRMIERLLGGRDK